MAMDSEAEMLLVEGREALQRGETASALEKYEHLITIERSAEICSALGYCLAKEKASFREAISLANEAVKKEPKEARHFLFLGRIYIMAGRKKEALRAFNLGLRQGPSQMLETELRGLGIRRAPVLPFLRRENPLNKFLGKLLRKWGLR